MATCNDDDVDGRSSSVDSVSFPSDGVASGVGNACRVNKFQGKQVFEAILVFHLTYMYMCAFLNTSTRGGKCTGCGYHLRGMAKHSRGHLHCNFDQKVNTEHWYYNT